MGNGCCRALSRRRSRETLRDVADLRCTPAILDLVEHAEAIDVALPLEAAQTEFAHRRRRFLGVVSAGRFVGVASAREITELLSNKFGHALFGRAPVGSHLLAGALVVASDLPVTELLRRSSERKEEALDQDVAVISADREFLGLLPMHRLVRLQNRLLEENLARVEAQRVELELRNRTLEDDLRLAREMQLAFLPSRSAILRGVDRMVEVRHVYEPADLIGGDFFSTFSPAPGVLACCVFDVMGHGVRPALVTAILRGLIEECMPHAADPGSMLTHLNTSLTRVLRAGGDLIFVTAGYAVIDLNAGSLGYAQAGHPAPLLWREDTGEAERPALAPDSAGPALGLIDECSYLTTTIPFGSGDALVLYTDGLLEAATPEGDEFGVGRLRAAAAEALAGEGEDAAGRIVEAARIFAGKRRFADDVCVLIARGARLPEDCRCGLAEGAPAVG